MAPPAGTADVHASGFANAVESWNAVWEDVQGLSAGRTERTRWSAAQQERDLPVDTTSHAGESRGHRRTRDSLP